MVHRDIKPANVIVSRDGVVKILDFGIARVQEGSGTLTGMAIGTGNYMSPEQVRGERVDQRSDIFATGAVFYELLTYRLAFPGNFFAATYQIKSGEPEPARPALSRSRRGRDSGGYTALQKPLSARYASVELIRRDIARLRAKYDTGEDPASTVLIVRQDPAGGEGEQEDVDESGAMPPAAAPAAGRSRRGRVRVAGLYRRDRRRDAGAALGSEPSQGPGAAGTGE